MRSLLSPLCYKRALSIIKCWRGSSLSTLLLCLSKSWLLMSHRTGLSALFLVLCSELVRVFLLFLHCLLCITAAALRTSPLRRSERYGAHTLSCNDSFILVDWIQSRTKALISPVFQNRSIIRHPVEVENKGVMSSFAVKAFCLFQH